MTRQRHPIARVIAGEFRGRRLSYPPGRAVRPTMQRTKSSVFESIKDYLRGCVFADLYAAGGAVGIEALSRGAAFAHFIEHDPDALSALAANLAAVGVSGDSYTIHDGDVATVLNAGSLRDAGLNLVFADPPYDANLVTPLLAHFDQVRYDELELLIVEHRGPLPPDLELGRLTLIKDKKFGETHVTYLSPNAGGRF